MKQRTILSIGSLFLFLCLFVIWIWNPVTALLFGLFSGALFIFGLFVRQKKALERLRQDIARDLHDELGGSLSNICLLSALVDREISEEKSKPVHEYLNKITEEATKVHDAIGDTIAMLSASYKNLGELSAQLNRYAYELFQHQGIDFELTLPEWTRGLEIPAGRRRDVYLLLKEALHNTVRHAQASKVAISFFYDNKRLFCMVTDDGCGFDAQQRYAGNGLKNMSRRAVLIEGKLAISSALGCGTTLRFSFPVCAPVQVRVWWHSFTNGSGRTPPANAESRPLKQKELPAQIAASH